MSIKRQAANAGKWSAITTGATVAYQLLLVYVLSHFLGEKDFGLYALAMIVMQLVQQFGDLGIGAAVIQKRDSAPDTLSSLYWLNVSFAFALGLLVILISPVISSFFGEPELAGLLKIAACIICITGFGQQFLYLMQKALAFRHIAYIEICSMGFGFAIASTMARYGFGAYTFMFGMLGQFALRTLAYVFVGRSYHRPRFFFSRKGLGEYLSFGLFLSGQQLVNVISSRLDTIVIGKFLGAEALGLYYFAQQFTSRIYTKITPIISRVAFPVLSRLNENSERLELGYRRLTELLCFIIFPCLFGMWVIVDSAIALFFNERWQNGVPIIRILLVLMVLRTMFTSAGTLLLAKARNDLGLFINLCIVPINLIALLIGINFGLIGVAWSLLGAGFFAGILWLWALRRFMGVDIAKLLRAIGPAIYSSGAMLCVALGAQHLLRDRETTRWVEFLLVIIIGVITYVCLAYLWQSRMCSMVMELYGRRKPASVH